MGLQVVGAADPRVRHDGRTAARFVGRGAAAVAVAAGIEAAVERVRRAELVAHLVGDIVNVKRITHRRVGAGLALGLETADASHAHTRQPAARGAEDMAEVVIGVADHCVQVRLVLHEQGRGVAVAVGLGERVGVDDLVVVGHQHQPDAQFRFVNPTHPVDRGDDGREPRRNRAAKERGVFCRRGAREPIASERTAGDRQLCLRR